MYESVPPQLVRDVTISDYVSPICLPYGQDKDNYLSTRNTASYIYNQFLL